MFTETCNMIRHIEKLQWTIFSVFVTVTFLALRSFPSETNPSWTLFFSKFIMFLVWYFLAIVYTKLNNAGSALALKLDSEDYKKSGYPPSDFLQTHEMKRTWKNHIQSPLDPIFWLTWVSFILIFGFMSAFDLQSLTLPNIDFTNIFMCQE